MGFIIPCAILFRSPTSVGLVHETVLLTHIKIKEQQNLRKTESRWHSRDKVMLNKDYWQPLFLDSSFYADVWVQWYNLQCVCVPTAWLVKGDDNMPFIIATFSIILILLRSIMWYMKLCILIMIEQIIWCRSTNTKNL